MHFLTLRVHISPMLSLKKTIVEMDKLTPFLHILLEWLPYSYVPDPLGQCDDENTTFLIPPYLICGKVSYIPWLLVYIPVLTQCLPRLSDGYRPLSRTLFNM